MPEPDQTPTQGPRGARGPRGRGFARVKSQALVYGCCIAAVGYSYIATRGPIDKVDRQGELTAFESLRDCIRSNVNSAVIKANAERGGNKAVPARVAKALYPIVDCKQAVLTGQTIELSPAETRRYVALVVKGRAPIINAGRVVGSRPRILDGLNSVDQAGKP